jgi:hypothetical protein
MGAGTIIAAVATIGSAIAALFEWLDYYDQRRLGRAEAALEAATREAGRAKERAKIESEVRRLDADALERELQSGSDASDR